MALRVVLFGAYVPAPPLQAPPVAPVTDPANVMVEAFAHTVPFGPAFTTGAGVMLIVRLLDTGRHVPLPVLVSVKVSVPEAISAAVGV